jgi:uncharacterized protein YdaT
MPWTAQDAKRHTKQADTPKRKRLWANVANSVLEQTKDEGRAVAAGNAAVAEDHKKSLFYRNLRYLLE